MAELTSVPSKLAYTRDQGWCLFIVVLDVISEEFRRGLPHELLFADDLAVVTDTEEEMQRRWLDWQFVMESRGLKVNIGKMEVMVSSWRGTKANIKDSQGTSLRQVNKFKYLGVTISEEGGSEEAVRARVSAAWGKWRYLHFRIQSGLFHLFVVPHATRLASIVNHAIKSTFFLLKTKCFWVT